jgi:hypothetical protein
MVALWERRRGRALTRLQWGYATGALSTQTLELRLDRALRAESPAALRQVTSDIQSPTLFDKLRALVSRPTPEAP